MESWELKSNIKAKLFETVKMVNTLNIFFISFSTFHGNKGTSAPKNTFLYIFCLEPIPGALAVWQVYDLDGTSVHRRVHAHIFTNSFTIYLVPYFWEVGENWKLNPHSLIIYMLLDTTGFTGPSVCMFYSVVFFGAMCPVPSCVVFSTFCFCTCLALFANVALYVA